MRKTGFALAIAVALAGMTPQVASAADGVSGAYLAAKSAMRAGDFEEAARFYTQALTRDPENPEIMEQLIRAQLSLGQADRAQPVAEVLEGSGYRSQLAHMLRVPALLLDGKYDETIARIADDRGVGKLVDGLVTGWAEMGAGRVSKALEALSKL